MLEVDHLEGGAINPCLYSLRFQPNQVFSPQVDIFQNTHAVGALGDQRVQLRTSQHREATAAAGSSSDNARHRLALPLGHCDYLDAALYARAREKSAELTNRSSELQS